LASVARSARVQTVSRQDVPAERQYSDGRRTAHGEPPAIQLERLDDRGNQLPVARSSVVIEAKRRGRRTKRFPQWTNPIVARLADDHCPALGLIDGYSPSAAHAVLHMEVALARALDEAGLCFHSNRIHSLMLAPICISDYGPKSYLATDPAIDGAKRVADLGLSDLAQFSGAWTGRRFMTASYSLAMIVAPHCRCACAFES